MDPNKRFTVSQRNKIVDLQRTLWLYKNKNGPSKDIEDYLDWCDKMLSYYLMYEVSDLFVYTLSDYLATEAKITAILSSL